MHKTQWVLLYLFNFDPHWKIDEQEHKEKRSPQCFQENSNKKINELNGWLQTNKKVKYLFWTVSQVCYTFLMLFLYVVNEAKFGCQLFWTQAWSSISKTVCKTPSTYMQEKSELWVRLASLQFLWQNNMHILVMSSLYLWVLYINHVLNICSF